jgi:Fe2+ transport system protein FeoA
MAGDEAVVPVTGLRPGESGVIDHLEGEPRDKIRLAGFGVAPGAKIRVVRHRPASVLEIGTTTLALDAEMAALIRVRRDG